MNLSGGPVRKMMDNFGKRDVEFVKSNFLLVVDDLEQIFGKFRIKKGGSPSGHNGTKGRWECYIFWIILLYILHVLSIIFSLQGFI